MSSTPPSQITFDAPAEIFATDSNGSFWFPLTVGGEPLVATGTHDEIRLLVSIWHPSSQRTIDLDRAYVESRASFDPEEEHWFKLAEIEPVVPPYDSGGTFDGWIVLPIFAQKSAFGISGSGLQPRARLQLRASAYLVA